MKAEQIFTMISRQERTNLSFSLNVDCSTREEANVEARRLIKLFKVSYTVIEWSFEVHRKAKDTFRLDFKMTILRQPT